MIHSTNESWRELAPTYSAVTHKNMAISKNNYSFRDGHQGFLASAQRVFPTEKAVVLITAMADRTPVAHVDLLTDIDEFLILLHTRFFLQFFFNKNVEDPHENRCVTRASS